MCSATASETGFRLFAYTRPTLSMRYNPSSTTKGSQPAANTSSRPGLHQPGLVGAGRRCQSAHARPSHQRSHIKPTRSHSQEPNTTGVPIPRKGRLSDPSESHVERADLTRMYDYATWNMYERIVNARRQRLNWLDAQSKQGADTSPDDAADISSLGAIPDTSKGGDFKVHSREDSTVTTLSTADDVESDKSSATLSSASSSVSTASLPGNLKKVFNLDAIKTALPQEQGKNQPEGESDEHFIFEMDM